METSVVEEKAPQDLGGKYLTFRLGHETYGLEILKVQEIIGITNVTLVPCTPDFVRGVINLRGKVIPVIDLRLKFGTEAKEDTDRTCNIVVQIRAQERELILGIVVDEVSEVLEIEANQIEPPPSFGTSVDTDFMLGMGKVGEGVVTLLNIREVLSGDEIALLDKTSH